MDSKLSDRLKAMARRAAGKVAPVKVRLRADLTGKKLTDAVRKVRSRLSGAEYLAISGTVHGTLPLDAAGAVSDLPEVESIDVELEVPTDRLIDPE